MPEPAKRGGGDVEVHRESHLMTMKKKYWLKQKESGMKEMHMWFERVNGHAACEKKYQ